MANSKLATWKYEGYTNHYNDRTHKIDKITIHHMAGNLSHKQAAEATQNRGGSWNYCITSEGKIGVMIDEQYRAWTSSSSPNDMRAVTIEVANDQIGGNWHVSDKALTACINLCVDICKRNGIKRLNFTGNQNGNLTMHRYFTATACPGPYLGSKFPYIAKEVNKRLSASNTVKETISDITGNIKNKLQKKEKAYLVKVTVSALNIRCGPGTNYKVVDKITNKGTYTIIASLKGKGAKKWGKLKSGAGWIALDYTKKL